MADDLRARARAELARRELARRQNVTSTSQQPTGQRVGTIPGLIRAGMQGATFGFADELAGGLAAAGALVPGGRSPREAYEAERDRIREAHGQFQEDRPGLAVGAEIAGAVPTLAVPGGAAVRGASLAGRAGRVAGAGATQAGLYGVGAAEGGVGRRLAGGATGAAVGAATGGVGRGVGQLLRGRAGRQAARGLVEEAPTTAALRREGGALFEAARESGEEVAGTKFGDFVSKLRVDLKGEGVDKVLHPKVARALRNMTKLAEKTGEKGKLNFQELFTLRRNLALGGRSLEPDERRLSRRAIEALDDFVETEAGAAGALSKQARNVWSRMRKSELIEDAIEKAQSRAAGVEAGLRNEFSKLYRNKKLTRGFSQEEKAAIKAVADGNLGANALRILGGLSIGEGQRRNIFAALGGILAGGAVGGGAGAVAAPIVGMGAQRLAQRGTMNRAQIARALAATGGRIPVPQRAQGALAEALARRAALPAAVVVNQ